MSASDLSSGWYVVARSKDVGKAPRRVWFNGKPIVLWRTLGGMQALEDFCPHRGAPLSAGDIRDGKVECPYHGWVFSGRGECTHMPSLAKPLDKVKAKAFQVVETMGLVFVRWGTSAEDYPSVHPFLSANKRHLTLSGDVKTTLADFAENILDTTHTSVLHKGYLRNVSGKDVVVDVKSTDRKVEASYPSQAVPSGFVSKFFGGGELEITDRFRAPSVAEVEYTQGDDIQFLSSFFLTPSRPGYVSAFVKVAVPQTALASVKLTLIRVLFERIFREDRFILEAVANNQAVFARKANRAAPQDVLRAGIEAILQGRSLPEEHTSQTIRM